MKKQAKCSWCLRVTTWTTQRTKALGHTVWYCQSCGAKTVDEPGFQGSEKKWEKYVREAKVMKELKDLVGKSVILRFRKVADKPRIVHLRNHDTITAKGNRAISYSHFFFVPTLGQLLVRKTKHLVALSKIASVQEVMVKVDSDPLGEEVVLTLRQ